MIDPNITAIDTQLTTECRIWRWQRTSGEAREAKRRTLDRIDRLLDQRNTATRMVEHTMTEGWCDTWEPSSPV